MSLIADPEFALYALRLAYLRRVDDPFGPRIIKFPDVQSRARGARRSDGDIYHNETGFGKSPALGGARLARIARGREDTVWGYGGGGSNKDRAAGEPTGAQQDAGIALLSRDSPVVIGGLNNPEYFPEIQTAYSPTLSTPLSDFAAREADTPGAGPSSLGGKAGNTGLGYTQTLYGPGRTGALGMRVSGRRSTSDDRKGAARGGRASGKPAIEVIEEDGDAQAHQRSAPSTPSDLEGPLGRIAMRSSSKEGTAATQSGWRAARAERMRKLAAIAASGQASGAATATQRTELSPSPTATRTAPSPRLSPQSKAEPLPASTSSGSTTAEQTPLRPPARPPRRQRGSSPGPTSPAPDSSGQHLSSPTPAPRKASTPSPRGKDRELSVGSGADGDARRSSARERTARIPSSSSLTQTGGNSSISEQQFSAHSRTRSSSEGARLPDSSTPGSGGAPEDHGSDEAGLSRTVTLDATPSPEIPLSPLWPHGGALKLNTGIPAVDPEKTPINDRHFFAPITEPDGSLFGPDGTLDALGSVPATPNGKSSRLSQLLQRQQARASGAAAPSTPPARLSGLPQILGEDGERLLLETDDEESDIGSPGSLAGAGLMSEVVNSEAIRASLVLDDGVLASLEEMDETDFGSGQGDVTGLPVLAGPGDYMAKSHPAGRKRSGTRSGQRPEHGSSDDEEDDAGPIVENDWFTSLKVDPRTRQTLTRQTSKPASALSARLREQDATPENPFAAFYAGVSARSDGSPSISVELYFPFAGKIAGNKPTCSSVQSIGAREKKMRVEVRKDATMEELIGFGLFCFIEEGWTPAFWKDAAEEERDVKTTSVGWMLRIVEDGEVDDDYPAIDRTLTVGKFGNDEFAIVEATSTQMQQNKATYQSIQRRVSRTAKPNKLAMSSLAAPDRGKAATGGIVPASISMMQETPIFPASALDTTLSFAASSVFLRVLITPNTEVRYKTTLQVPSEMYLADVLETICRKRRLGSPDEWALIVPDRDIVVPLDRTVESLQGTHDLTLVKRASLGEKGGLGALTARSTNPNASIFNKRHSEPAQPRYNILQDLASVYKSWTVNRRAPMFVNKTDERTFTIDGDWLHILPLDVRAFQTRAASFHVSSIITCDISTKGPQIFKLIVRLETPKDTKRYDFEADGSRMATEIVGEVKALMERHSRDGPAPM